MSYQRPFTFTKVDEYLQSPMIIPDKKTSGGLIADRPETCIVLQNAGPLTSCHSETAMGEPVYCRREPDPCAGVEEPQKPNKVLLQREGNH